MVAVAAGVGWDREGVVRNEERSHSQIENRFYRVGSEKTFKVRARVGAGWVGAGGSGGRGGGRRTSG